MLLASGTRCGRDRLLRPEHHHRDEDRTRRWPVPDWEAVTEKELEQFRQELERLGTGSWRRALHALEHPVLLVCIAHEERGVDDQEQGAVQEQRRASTRECIASPP